MTLRTSVAVKTTAIATPVPRPRAPQSSAQRASPQQVPQRLARFAQPAPRQQVPQPPAQLAPPAEWAPPLQGLVAHLWQPRPALPGRRLAAHGGPPPDL